VEGRVHVGSRARNIGGERRGVDGGGREGMGVGRGGGEGGGRVKTAEGQRGAEKRKSERGEEEM